MPHDSNVVPVMHVAAIIEALHEHLRGTHSYARAALPAGVVSCFYHHWLRPLSKRRQYCQVPVSGTRM